jgi:hypothetical protein
VGWCVARAHLGDFPGEKAEVVVPVPLPCGEAPCTPRTPVGDPVVGSSEREGRNIPRRGEARAGERCCGGGGWFWLLEAGKGDEPAAAAPAACVGTASGGGRLMLLAPAKPARGALGAGCAACTGAAMHGQLGMPRPPGAPRNVDGVIVEGGIGIDGAEHSTLCAGSVAYADIIGMMGMGNGGAMAAGGSEGIEKVDGGVEHVCRLPSIPSSGCASEKGSSVKLIPMR